MSPRIRFLIPLLGLIALSPLMAQTAPDALLPASEAPGEPLDRLEADGLFPADPTVTPDLTWDDADLDLDAGEDFGPVVPPATPQQVLANRFYLFARLNQPHQALPLARRILKESPGDKQALLVLASMYLERRDARRVLFFAREVLRWHPGDEQGLYFLAAGYSVAGRNEIAESILKNLRRTEFAGRRFPYNTDLASSARLTGDWRTAMSTYQTLLEDREISPALRDEARRVLDEIYREHLPQATYRGEFQYLIDSGSILRNTLEGSAPFSNRIRLSAWLHRDDLTQFSQGVARGFSTARNDGLLAATRLMQRDWHLTLGLGGSTAGLLAAVASQHDFGPGKRLTLSFDYNARATDSLALELLDGRQNRLQADILWALPRGFTFAAAPSIRQVTVDGEVLGHGAGVDWRLERNLIRKPIEITLAWVGQFQGFDTTNTNSDLVAPLFVPGATPAEEEDALGRDIGNVGSPDTLITSPIHYQGLNILFRWKPLTPLVFESALGSGYYFNNSQLDYGGMIRAVYRPRKSAEIAVETGYRNNGLESNTGTQVLYLTLDCGLKF